MVNLCFIFLSMAEPSVIRNNLFSTLNIVLNVEHLAYGPGKSCVVHFICFEKDMELPFNVVFTCLTPPPCVCVSHSLTHCVCMCVQDIQ